MGWYYAIDNNYSKDPIIKTTKDLKSLFYFEAFLAALLSLPYWPHYIFFKRALQFTMRYIVW